MGLDSVGIDIYDIHGYFRELTVDQRTPGFWGIIGIGEMSPKTIDTLEYAHRSRNEM